MQGGVIKWPVCLCLGEVENGAVPPKVTGNQWRWLLSQASISAARQATRYLLSLI